MPFTPFHLGPALAIGLPLRKVIHAPTFIVANVIVDVEPLTVIILGLNYPYHGYVHTFLGAFLLGLLTALVMQVLEPSLRNLWKTLRLETDVKLRTRAYVAAGVSGTLLHVLLDSPLYTDIRPFYPWLENPLFNPATTPYIYGFCVVTGIIGLAYYLLILVRPD